FLSDYLEKKVNRKQDHDCEYYQQSVLNHSRLQKGDYAATLDRSFTQLIDACVNYLVIILIAEVGYAPVNDQVHDKPIKTVYVPSLGEQPEKRRNPLYKTDLLCASPAEFQPRKHQSGPCKTQRHPGRQCKMFPSSRAAD